MEGSSAVPMPRGYRQPRCGRGDGGGIRGCYFERQRCECEYEKRMNGTAPPTATTATAAAGQGSLLPLPRGQLANERWEMCG